MQMMHNLHIGSGLRGPGFQLTSALPHGDGFSERNLIFPIVEALAQN